MAAQYTVTVTGAATGLANTVNDLGTPFAIETVLAGPPIGQGQGQSSVSESPANGGLITSTLTVAGTIPLTRTLAAGASSYVEIQVPAASSATRTGSVSTSQVTSNPAAAATTTSAASSGSPASSFLTPAIQTANTTRTTTLLEASISGGSYPTYVTGTVFESGQAVQTLVFPLVYSFPDNRTLSPPTGSKPGSGGLSPGAVAGAAVGAAVGAALLAFLATFFLCRRKRGNSRGTVYSSEKSQPSHPWETFLPQSADDNTMQAAVQSLYSQIDLHVENFYGNNPLGTISAGSRAGLTSLDSDLLPRPAEQLLLTATPLPVIKHFYASAILNKLSPTKNGEKSLLPAELARLPPAPASSKHRSYKESESMMPAYDYWRVLTAHLMYPRSNKNISGTQNLRFDDRAVSQALSSTFEPWLKSENDKLAAEEHLQSVLRTASETGLLIMSQRSSFLFEWDVLDKSRDTGNSVVVMPAFTKTADEHGEALGRHQVLLKPRVEEMAL